MLNACLLNWLRLGFQKSPPTPEKTASGQLGDFRLQCQLQLEGVTDGIGISATLSKCQCLNVLQKPSWYYSWFRTDVQDASKSVHFWQGTVKTKSIGWEPW